MTYNAS